MSNKVYKIEGEQAANISRLCQALNAARETADGIMRKAMEEANETYNEALEQLMDGAKAATGVPLPEGFGYEINTDAADQGLVLIKEIEHPKPASPLGEIAGMVAAAQAAGMNVEIREHDATEPAKPEPVH